MKTRQTRRAFTLIELLVVIVIITILAGIVFKVGTIVAQKAGRAKTLQSLEHMKHCLAAYYGAYGEYPSVSGVRWEEPTAGAGAPDNWDDVLAAVREQGGAWAGFGVNTRETWDALYPFLYNDERRPEWDEYLQQVNGGPAGFVEREIDGSEFTAGGGGFGTYEYTNRVFSIRDGWEQDFYYEVGAENQSYTLYSVGADGIDGTPDDVGREGWAE